MERQVITIDQDKCIGCGLCVSACQESAIALVDGKATLLSDDYCDGLGNCLPTCPTGAISFETRVAAPFDKEKVHARQAQLRQEEASKYSDFVTMDSQLQSFPVQLSLVLPTASFFDGASLLIAADCAAYAHGDFHRRFIKGRVPLIGCPKLDHDDYAAKLTEILSRNDIRDISLVRMEVPCCGGIQRAFLQALKACNKSLPWQVFTLSTQGEVIAQESGLS